MRASRAGEGERRLVRAITAAEARRLGRARGEVMAALAAADVDAALEVAAAAVLFVTRDYEACFACLDRAAAHPGLLRRATEDRVAYASSLGWDQEAREALERAIAREPDEPTWRAHMTRLLVRAGAPDRALVHAGVALERADRSPRMRMEVANLLAEVGQVDEARRMVHRALEVAPRGARLFLVGAAEILAGTGDVAGAQALLRRILVGDPDDAALLRSCADLSLWTGDIEAAEADLDRAAAIDPASPALARLRGVVALLRGDRAAAIARLDEALAGDPDDYLALTLRAELALREGDWDGAHERLSRATMRAPGFHVVAWMIRFLVVAGDPRDPPDADVKPNEIEEFQAALCEIVPGAQEALRSRQRAQLCAALEEALARMRGNRSVRSTYVDDAGALRRLAVRDGVRYASRRALQLIRTLPPSEVLEALDAVVLRFPRAALPICHRGELRLWLGDLAGARADLEAAIERHTFTRWAYIGLAGVDLLEGAPARALRTLAHGVAVMGDTEGPAVYVYRGEARRLLGDLAGARADLERAIAISDKRLGAWLNLALIEAQEGHGAAFEAIWAHLERAAVGLLAEAALIEEVVLWDDPGHVVAIAERARVIARALAMLGGNRSTSAATYFNRQGRLHYVQSYSAAAHHPHDFDPRALERARAVLGQREALLRGPAPVVAAAPPRRRPALRVLGAGDVDHFLEHGYVRLRGAYSRALAAEWVADACRRIRDEPERWIDGYDRSDGAADLSAFDPADPATWAWPLINLRGARHLPFAEFSPRLWGAIADLVGGEDRIATRRFSDYFIVNLRPKAGRRDVFPGRGGEAWHVDHPSRRTRLVDLRNGLVGVALFSDLTPSAGGTWLAADSVPRVVRLLADHPDGVDLVDHHAAAAITTQCERFVEVTGEVGDVFLLHPLMIHAGTINPSGRIRWMANPNIELTAPMRFDRRPHADHSPVELMIRQALDRAR